MQNRTFYIVDVFAEQKYAGNQLAVVRDANRVSDDEMQRIAKEMNYSETSFILSDKQRNGGYDARYFTPKTEVPFAGHPTLGTAYVIQREIIRKAVEDVTLNLKVGQIPVSLTYRGEQTDLLWMKQKQPTFGQAYDPQPVAQVLNIHPSDIDQRFTIREVSTGIPFIITPLKTLDAVRKIRVAKDEYFDMVKDTWAKSILVFCPETYDPKNDLNVRVFADYHGVPEDPATGSANGCLAAYLAKDRYFGTSHVDIRVEQGYEIGRPSLLYLRADAKQDSVDVHVGGRVEMVARGELL